MQPAPDARSSQQVLDDVLDLEDVTGKRIVETRLHRNITIREENSIAALEVMSRFATDPHWLIYLPPTMSPSETSSRRTISNIRRKRSNTSARTAYRRSSAKRSIWGRGRWLWSAATLKAARERFGVIDGRVGVCYTRTGRAFFPEPADEAEFVARVQAALSKAGFWDEFASDWFCLDCELMPWSAKARELIQRQYAAVGAAGVASLEAVLKVVRTSPAAAGMAQSYYHRLDRLRKYREAYRRYCWPVTSLADYRLAPFHLLASEGAVHTDKTNRWHMETLHRLDACDPPFMLATPLLEMPPLLPKSSTFRAAPLAESIAVSVKLSSPTAFKAESSRPSVIPSFAPIRCASSERRNLRCGALCLPALERSAASLMARSSKQPMNARKARNVISRSFSASDAPTRCSALISLYPS